MTVEYKGITFEHPGHATVRMETSDNVVVYIDLWSKVLDGTPADADVVFSTHDDRDHYDPAAIETVAKPSATIVAYEGIDTSDLDSNIVPLAADGTTSIAGIDVHAVPAYHRPGGPHVRPSGEPYLPEETVIGLVLTVDETTVYFSSDTDALEELAAIEADVMLPPIGGIYTMNRNETAALVREIDPEPVLPVHYDTEAIEGIDADAAAFEAELGADGIRVELF